jgi:transposase
MIDADKRKAIYQLHKEGVGKRAIARLLKVSRNTVSTVIEQQGDCPETTRKDKIVIDPALLQELYGSCDGWVQRIHEKLAEEQAVQVGYSTLTRQIRALGLSTPTRVRCDQVPDEPGAEMQHDTSPYCITLGDKPTPVVGSLLYFRYCKVRYLKFYRAFNRFRMKCFLHEALSFWGYSAPVCIIDNTNLARLRGSGQNAVMVPEMIRFAQQYGFEFVCHAIGHSNRKAGNERGFYTVETNFFPGRTFASLEDLNQQALEWATVRMAQRPVGKALLLPAKAFEYEQAFLLKLPPVLSPPYQTLPRMTDQYGYTSVDGNFYWVPGTSREDVMVLQYSDHLKIYQQRRCLAEYPLPAEGVKNQKFSPPGQPTPRYQPASRKHTTSEEEQRLRALSPVVGAYLDQALSSLAPMGRQRHHFVRHLHGLYQQLAEPLFIQTLERALNYRITSLETLERIARLLLKEGDYVLPEVTVDPDLPERDTYREGCWSDPVDLSRYDQLLGDEDG